jgi:predicted transcriptional regulator YdeE
MGYTIEVSYDFMKKENPQKFKETLEDLATQLQCSHYYFHYDYDVSNPFLLRNHCIFVVCFEDEQTNALTEFIRCVKTHKHTFIECLYQENIPYVLMYASPIYRKGMTSDGKKLYKENKRQRSYSDEEQTMLMEIRKRVKSKDKIK